MYGVLLGVTELLLRLWFSKTFSHCNFSIYHLLSSADKRINKSNQLLTIEKNGVKIRQVMTKCKHTHTAFVEALNKILAERLFKVQDAQELNDPEEVSSTWLSICMD